MDPNPSDKAGSILQHALETQLSGNGDVAYDLFAQVSEMDPEAAEAWRGRAVTSTQADDALVSSAYATALRPSDQTLASEFEQRLQARLAGAATSAGGRT